MIVQGDARRLPISSESVDLIVTSPPYNLGKDYGETSDMMTFDGWTYFMWRSMNECYRVLKPGGRICLNVPLDINIQYDKLGYKHSTKVNIAARMTQLLNQWLIYNTTIIWLEENISKRTAWGSWLSASDPWINTAAETILVFSKGQRKRPDSRGRISDIAREEFMDWTLGLWRFSGESAKRIGHPAPFPKELPRRCIKLFSFVGDTVLDPFVGSGTTVLVAEEHGRRGIGVDLSLPYCNLARDRLPA